VSKCEQKCFVTVVKKNAFQVSQVGISRNFRWYGR